MKTLKTLLLIAAVAAIGATFSAKADEPLYSPKGKEQADSHRTVATSQTDVNLAAIPPAGKAGDRAQLFRKVPASGPSIDLAHATRPTLAPKDPGFETAWRANAERGFQVAPLK